MRFEIASASLSILYNYIDIAMHCNLTYENSNITAVAYSTPPLDICNI